MDHSLTRTEELDRRHRRIMMVSLLLSLLVHASLLLWSSRFHAQVMLDSAAGRRTGDDRAAAAGGVQAVTLRLEQEVVIRPPEPVTIADVVVEVEEVQPSVEIEAVGFEGLAGDETGPGEGPGVDDGTGTGDGGTGEEGLFRQLPPTPRSLMTAPSGVPSSIRGKEIQVAVFVDESGRVVPDSTRIQPPSGNSRYDEELMRRAAQWLFEPATRGGERVAAWFEYTLTF
ncbi:MAG TPA: energy transducer TonB [Longimicrobiales bacterium]|nr:energy transducer TonB [Longimicrobiales bacterium]